YDPVFRRLKNHAYVEFSSNENARKCVDRVNDMEFQGKRLNASVGGDLSESVDDYIPCSVRLYNLHWKTTKGEVARFFPGSISITLSTKTSRDFVGRRQSIVANLMFGTTEEAIAAVDEK
ncbi:RNA-binding protein, partial [Nitriliruptoraceae bacterium ZYF776]|nr:RNA-binding protein [Profundirhabdus halotolerans]